MRSLLLMAILLLCSRAYTQLREGGIFINEISQGTSGNKEFIELLASGTKSCPDTTIDISKWIIDDQNGWFAQGAGAGISGGHYRFRDTLPWKQVPIGALLLIYNDADKNTNPGFPVDDAFDADRDGVYVLPISSPLLEYSTLPANGSANPAIYGGVSYTRGSGVAEPQNWSRISLRDDGDVLVLVKPNGGYTNPASFYAVAYYGNPFMTGPASPTITKLITGSGNRLTYYFNSSSGDYSNSNAWLTGTAGTATETPGKANSAENDTWIHLLRQHPMRTTDIAISPVQASVCFGGVTLTAYNTWSATGVGNWQWNWSPASGLSATSGSTVVASPPVTTTYLVAGKDTANCEDTAFVTVQVVAPAPAAAPVQQFCTGATVAQLSSNGTNTTWYSSLTGGSALSPALPLVSGSKYYVSQTVNGCESSRTEVSVLLKILPSPVVNVVRPGCTNPRGSITVTNVFAGGAYSIDGMNYQASNVFPDVPAGFYHVTIKYDSCVSASTAVNIATFAGAITVTARVAPESCEGGGEIAVKAVGGTTPYNYSIDGVNYQSSEVFRGLHQGSYTVTVKDANGCTAAITSMLARLNNFNLQLTMAPAWVLAQTTVVLQTAAAIAYEVIGWRPAWMFANQQLKRQTIVADSLVRVWVVGKTPAGCIDSAAIMLDVRQPDQVYVPSAFTPNADAKNDVLKVWGVRGDLELKIINRFGQLVFYSKDARRGWDGSLAGVAQPAGVYAYILRFGAGSQARLLKGTVTLIR